MEILGIVLLCIGALISIIYGIMLLIIAFRKSVIWGLAYLLIPFASLVFVVVHWEDTKSPFLKGLIAIPFLIAGSMLLPENGGAY